MGINKMDRELGRLRNLILTICFLFICSTAFSETNHCSSASGCWGMEYDTTTTEEDLTTNNEDLTVSASDSIPRSTDKKFGTYSRDFEADDVDFLYHADAGSTDINGVDANITIAAWIKIETLISGMTVASKYNATGNQMSWLLNINDSGGNAQLQGLISSDGASTGRTITNSGTNYVAIGGWSHVAIVYNDVDIRLYINGVLANSPAAHTAGLFNSSAQFRVGARGDSSSPFDGLIDDVIIDNSALTQAQVQEAMRCGMQGNQCRRIIPVQ